MRLGQRFLSPLVGSLFVPICRKNAEQRNGLSFTSEPIYCNRARTESTHPNADRELEPVVAVRPVGERREAIVAELRRVRPYVCSLQEIWSDPDENLADESSCTN